MFESQDKLKREIHGLLGALRELGEGRYACLLEPKGVLFEEADPEAPPPWALRRFLEERASALFALPRALHAGEEMEDVFASWADDGFYLAFVNGRVAVIVTSPEPQTLEDEGGRILKVLVDRMVRYNSAWRMDERGRGLFFTRPRLDTVVVGRQSEEDPG